MQISDFVQRKQTPGQLLGQIVDVEPDGKFRILALGTPLKVYGGIAGIRTIETVLIESYQYFHENPGEVERWDSSTITME